MKPKHTGNQPPGLAAYAMAKKEIEGPKPKKHTKVIVTQVYFSLPNWYPPARYDIHGSRNAYHRRWYKNKALDNLMRLKGAATFSPRQIIFEFKPGVNINKKIKETRGKIDRLLNRYKEAQEGDTANENI